MTAQLFSPGIVSTDVGELNSVFSPDYQEFYFTRRGIPGVPPRIMVSRRGPEGWEKPEPVAFDQRFSGIDLFITPDGRRMVFCSNRPHDRGGSPRDDHDFWVSGREGSGWGEPELFAPEAMSDSQDFYPIITGDGNLYFNSQRDGPGTNHIFRASLVEGRYGQAEKLPDPVNSEFREFDAFVSLEEDLIIFSSDRPGGLGRADLYLSLLDDGRWSEPKNLGAAVNSGASEYGAMLSPDGRFLFFTSSRSGMEDIYWVSAEVLGLPEG
jgi:Tol biopolymer transport system component